MGRSPCCSKVGLRRGPWSTKEDSLLANFIHHNGEGQWRSLPRKAGLLRCGKSCRLRWMNYLRPGIKRGNITQDEEDLIVRLHGLLGNRWSLIAGRLPGRTDNEIKNYWNTHLIKKLKAQPATTAAMTKNNKTAVVAKAENEEDAAQPNAKEEVAAAEDDPPKTKVYLPKPTRVSPAFSLTCSYDSLTSPGIPNSDAAAAVEVASFFTWWLLIELEDAGVDRDFLGGGFVPPVLNRSDSMSSDVNMLEKVFDEYLQLL